MSSLRRAVLVTTTLINLGCTAEPDVMSSGDQNVVEVPHSPVKDQVIGNCPMYALAGWAESMHLSATGEVTDLSESYLSYWHWYEQLVEGDDEVATGLTVGEAGRALIGRRGLMAQAAFTEEGDDVQRLALDLIETELASGRLDTAAERADGANVRDVLDDAFGLSDEVAGELDEVFGEDGSLTFNERDVSAAGTAVIDPEQFAVLYKRRAFGFSINVETQLDAALREWNQETYPRSGSNLGRRRRDFLRRIQRALHDLQPVVIVWAIDFNARTTTGGETQGAFNLIELEDGPGPGGQGFHASVLADYAAVSPQHGVLPAGETVDPAILNDLLGDDTTVTALRIKNSWGTNGAATRYPEGMLGFNDLHLDYLDGPIPWCPDNKLGPDNDPNRRCEDEIVPFRYVLLPPGY